MVGIEDYFRRCIMTHCGSDMNRENLYGYTMIVDVFKCCQRTYG
jgi:hypothetical protein